MTVKTAVALVLALVSTTLTNLAYLREHDAAADLPVLSMRRPIHSVRLLLGDRSWLRGFAMETTGFLLYAAALALASLALVQSIAAGGIGVLAFASARLAGRSLPTRELVGAITATLGLVALAVSLAGGSPEGGKGETITILTWFGATAGLAALVVSVGRRVIGIAVAYGIAAGLLFSLGDISTKVATEGGVRAGFALTLILGYSLGTALLQIGYQQGAALTVAGLAVLLTNALPIAAGTIILNEPVPSGAFGGLRILAFAAVTIGALLLARPQGRPAKEATAPAPERANC